eukprot:6449706-Amphidinium_carterae.1
MLREALSLAVPLTPTHQHEVPLTTTHQHAVPSTPTHQCAVPLTSWRQSVDTRHFDFPWTENGHISQQREAKIDRERARSCEKLEVDQLNQ